MSLSKRLIAGGAPDVGYQGGAFTFIGGGNQTDKTNDVGFEADTAFLFPTGGYSNVYNNYYLIDRDVLGTFNWIEPAASWVKTSVTGGCIAWNSNGFTIKANNDTQYKINNSSQSFTGMSFKTSDTGVSNTDGSITSTVYANPDFGVSKIKFTGTNAAGTIGHGLGTTPQLVLFFALDSYSSGTGTKSCSMGTYRYHNEGSNQEWRRGTAGNKMWVGPHEDVGTFTANSTTITLDNSSQGGKSNNVYLVIAFASASGFSKYQSYTGNSSTSTRTILSADFDPSSIFIMGNNNNLWLDESFRTSGTTLPRWDSGDITNLYQQSATFNLGTGEYIRADWRTNKRVLLNTDSYSCNTNGDRNGVIAFGGDNWNPVP